MITIHHLEDSRSQRIIWLCEELNLDYQVARYERDEQTQLAPDALKQLHPLGVAPILEDGDLKLVESGAIIEYLLEKYDTSHQLRPQDLLSQAGRDYRFWLHYGEGSVMPLLVMAKVFMTVKHSRMPFFAKPVARKIANSVEQAYIEPGVAKALTFANQQLTHQDYFIGDTLSGADIQMSFPLEAAATMPELIADYPHISRWVERIHARSAYQVALDKGGPYSFA